MSHWYPLERITLLDLIQKLIQKVVLVMDNDGALIYSDKIFIRNYPETPRQNVTMSFLPPLVDCLDKTDMT